MQLSPKKCNPHVFRKFCDLLVDAKRETLISKAFPMSSTPRELNHFQSGNIVPLATWRYSPFNLFKFGVTVH